MEVEVDSKAKRTYARSLFKDDEIRTLLMAKFHQQQVNYINASIQQSELVPFKGKLFFCQKVSPIAETLGGKGDHPSNQIFECLQDSLAETGEIVEVKEIITLEKGQASFEYMINERKRADEERRQKEEEAARALEVPTYVIKQQNSRQAVKHKKRNDRYHLKDFAESARNIDFQLKQMRDMQLPTEKLSDAAIEVKDEGHVPSMVTFKRF